MLTCSVNHGEVATVERRITQPRTGAVGHCDGEMQVEIHSTRGGWMEICEIAMSCALWLWMAVWFPLSYRGIGIWGTLSTLESSQLWDVMMERMVIM